MYKIIIDKNLKENEFLDKNQILRKVELNLQICNKTLMVTRYISIDPIMRVWLSGAQTYLPSLIPGSTMHAFCMSSPHNNPKEFYFGTTGLSSNFYLEDQENMVKIPNNIIETLQIAEYEPYSFLAITLNGLPAYFGLIDICNIKPNQNVLISTAAGVTGLFAIQMALLKGCNVIGLTSNQEKIAFLESKFPQLTLFNYKDNNWIQQIQQQFPDGIDVYFDNVGGEQLDQVIGIMKDFGSIALCGATSTYNNYSQRIGLKNSFLMVTKRLKMKGLTFYNDDKNKLLNAYKYILKGIQEGKIQLFQQCYIGIQKIEHCLKIVIDGQNIGKYIIELKENQKL